MDVLDVIWHGLRDAFLMAWEVWWALVLGFAISAIVQAWVPRARVERALSGSGARPVGMATVLGAASSSCSYAAFARHAPQPFQALENVIVGPIIAVVSFVCSVGNVPLAAVLWSGGISFGGVVAFLFADLIVLPIVAIYRKYYGAVFAARVTVLMFVTIVIAGLLVDLLFGALGLIPSGARPSRESILGSVQVDYKLFLNVVATVIFAWLFLLVARRGATDPVCGMKVDRAKVLSEQIDGERVYFCSEHCLHTFEAQRRLRAQHHPPLEASHAH